MKAMITHMIEENRNREYIERKIMELNEYDIVKVAKRFFENQTMKSTWPELEIMISDISSSDYYNWRLQQISCRNLKNVLKKVIKMCKQ